MVPDRQSGTCVGSSLPTQNVSATAMGVRGVIASDVVVEIKVKPTVGADPPNEVEAVTGRRSCTCVSWGSLPTQVASAAAMCVWEAIASDMVVEIVVQPIVVVTTVVSMVIVFVIAIVILLIEKEALTVLVVGCAAIVVAAPEGVVALVAPKPSYERVGGPVACKRDGSSRMKPTPVAVSGSRISVKGSS